MASNNQRNFRPRSPIPKQKLLDDLIKGLTLEEIGIKYKVMGYNVILLDHRKNVVA